MTEQTEVLEIKTFTTTALVVEDDAIIINIGGWRKRVYFEMANKDLKEIKENKNKYKGRNVVIEYQGDLDSVFDLKLLPLKKLF